MHREPPLVNEMIVIDNSEVKNQLRQQHNEGIAIEPLRTIEPLTSKFSVNEFMGSKPKQPNKGLKIGSYTSKKYKK